MSKSLFEKSGKYEVNSPENRNSILATKNDQLKLSQLREVEYINNKTMLLVFVDDANIKANLFIQFDDEEELNKWDLGLYINFKIISSLHKEKLFLSEKVYTEYLKKEK